jgi:hypothetical protein
MKYPTRLYYTEADKSQFRGRPGLQVRPHVGECWPRYRPLIFLLPVFESVVIKPAEFNRVILLEGYVSIIAHRPKAIVSPSNAPIVD